MFEALFLNPAALTVGGAMISAPILIHLINRMRFKRLRWAAMEFLLKSQKRNRRRLIIEQLLLLLLRCLLILLAALLLSRFIGCSGAWGQTFEQKSNLHVIILDDTLSMQDKVRDRDDCFKTAKRDIQDTVARSLAQSTTDDGLVILRPSDVTRGPDNQPKVVRRLNDSEIAKGLESDLAEMQCTDLRISLLASLQKAKDIAENAVERVTVHVLSDFRKNDWTGPDAKDLHKLMTELGKHENVKKVFLVDTSHPFREPEQGGLPVCHDNLGIVEVRPNTRVASAGSKVTFTVTIANFSPRDADVKVVPYSDLTGQAILEKEYEPPTALDGRVKVQAGKTAQAIFSMPARAEVREDGKAFDRIGVRLFTAAGLPLENDGLTPDNIRHSVIEVRKTVPILIIDGRGDEGRRPGGDSYYVATALRTVVNSKYEVHFGDELARGDPREALESPELGNYTSILLINVPRLQNDKQRENLERFVKDGGGICFFMGPDVQAKYYNDELFRKGFGVFPVPIADTFYPLAGVKLPPPELTGRNLVELRDDQFAKSEKVPIFGPVFREPRLRDFLKHLPVQRHWPAKPPEDWISEVGQVREVANLPNEEVAAKFANEIEQFVQKLPIDRDEYRPYHAGLKRHSLALRGAISKGTSIPAYKLATWIDAMLVDRGKDNDRADYPNLVEFWDLRDQYVQDLKQDAVNLRKRLLFGNPLVVVKDFGRGRVVAWMTTAGKEWNDWPGGITGSPVYAPLIYELQNYLTSQSGDSGLLVGDNVDLTVDAKRFDRNKALVIQRTRYKPVLDQPESKQESPAFQGALEKDIWTFKLTGAITPGFYESLLTYGGSRPDAAPLERWGHAFNVDSRNEGNLQRTSQEDMESAFLRQVASKAGWRRPSDMSQAGILVNRAWDLSEWPFFFLIFICILVAEQALAVHLSFHLRTNEAELPAQVAQPQAKAA